MLAAPLRVGTTAHCGLPGSVRLAGSEAGWGDQNRISELPLDLPDRSQKGLAEAAARKSGQNVLSTRTVWVSASMAGKRGRQMGVAVCRPQEFRGVFKSSVENERIPLHTSFYAVATHRRYASLHSTLIDTLFCGP
jgi:hypothetical protein